MHDQSVHDRRPLMPFVQARRNNRTCWLVGTSCSDVRMVWWCMAIGVIGRRSIGQRTTGSVARVEHVEVVEIVGIAVIEHAAAAAVVVAVAVGYNGNRCPARRTHPSRKHWQRPWQPYDPFLRQHLLRCASSIHNPCQKPRATKQLVASRTPRRWQHRLPSWCRRHVNPGCNRHTAEVGQRSFVNQRVKRLEIGCKPFSHLPATIGSHANRWKEHSRMGTKVREHHLIGQQVVPRKQKHKHCPV